MIQDLNEMAVLGVPHLALLERIGVTAADLDEAAVMSKDLAALLARRDAERGDQEALDLRKRAFADLRATVTEIRACGAFAFRKDPERVRRCASASTRGSIGGRVGRRRPRTRADCPGRFRRESDGRGSVAGGVPI